jgi:hypothetical protein
MQAFVKYTVVWDEGVIQSIARLALSSSDDSITQATAGIQEGCALLCGEGSRPISRVQTESAERCPFCRRPMQPEAAVCLECGFNRASGKLDLTRVEPEEAEPEPLTWKERWQQTRLDSFWEWEIPLGLILGSFAFIGLAHVATAEWSSLPKVLFATVVLALMEAAWIYAGMSVMELMTSIEFGDWRTALLKLFSIASFWYALGVLFEWQAPGIGWTMHAAIAWPVQFFLLRWMFSLDSFWAIMTMIVVALTQGFVSWLTPW